MSGEVNIPVRRKFRTRGMIKSTKYRARTGPSCCNKGCGKRHPFGYHPPIVARVRGRT